MRLSAPSEASTSRVSRSSSRCTAIEPKAATGRGVNGEYNAVLN